LSGVSLEDFLHAVNSVQPSFIRVEADEVTYNLHIMLRFELEQKLIAGELEAKDVPEVWDATFTRDFGITPPDDSQGCLQDIHWSFGGIGYFPTYTLGNMCAAQFYGAISRDLGDLPAYVRRGDFRVIKDWLNQKIHRHGKREHCRKLVERVSGETLSHRPLVQHLREKFGELYGF
jgi:carboxypeptidase Taq